MLLCHRQVQSKASPHHRTSTDGRTAHSLSQPPTRPTNMVVASVLFEVIYRMVSGRRLLDQVLFPSRPCREAQIHSQNHLLLMADQHTLPLSAGSSMTKIIAAITQSKTCAIHILGGNLVAIRKSSDVRLERFEKLTRILLSTSQLEQ